MKRDMDLIRKILLARESEQPLPTGYSEEEIVYNTALLIDAGFVRGRVIRDATGTIRGGAIQEITWAGHEFLDLARNEQVWKKAMMKTRSAGVEVSLQVLKELLTSTVKGLLGLS